LFINHLNKKEYEKKHFGIGMAVLGFVVVAVLNFGIAIDRNNLSASLSLDNVEALAECETTVTFNGSIWTVTVCNKKTGLTDYALGLYCSRDATTSCSFSNMEPTPKI